MESAVGKTSKKTGNAVKLTILFLLLAVYMFPFFLTIINAFKSNAAILRTPLSLTDPNGLSLDNFVLAFKEMNFVNTFFNSLVITVVSVVIIVLLSSMTAYFFVRMKWKINSVLFGIMVAAMIIPFQVIMIPLISIYGGVLGLLANRGTLIFMNVGFGLSMAIFIYHGFIKSGVPISLEEAATLDGCSRLQTFFKVVFPLLKPTTATIVVLDVLWLWNDYLLPSLVLTKEALYTLPLTTYVFRGAYFNNYGALMAGLVLSTLPVIVLYIFLQKQIISGVVSGAVKS